MEMAANIRCYRERAGMYQTDLGKALGVSAQAVSKWELGKAEPDRDSILKMCSIFGISADELLGREPQKNAAHSGGLREETAAAMADLSPDELRQVIQYAEFLKASRKSP